MSAEALSFISELEAVIRERQAHPQAGSYTADLLAAGGARIAQKLGEEGLELALASVIGDKDRVVAEAADLVYHLLVLLQSHEIGLAEVAAELARRRR